jgi:hypothetical protein
MSPINLRDFSTKSQRTAPLFSVHPPPFGAQ